eukprot:116477-Pyramimonas_sp.AAC.1
MGEVATKRPQGSLLFTAGDLNGGIGITCKNEHPEGASLGIGRAKEKLPGGAGHETRQYAERHRLTVTKTMGAWRPTFFGEITAS